MRRWLATWLPVVLWAAVIFGASSIPGTQIPAVDLPLADKLAHLLVYAVLGALLLRALQRPAGARALSSPDARSAAPPAWSWRQAGIAVLLATLYGISDEIHQRWTPNRTPDWHDVVADALGGALGTLALVAMRWMKIRACLMMERSKS